MNNSKMVLAMSIALSVGLCGVATAKKDDAKPLPPGLQKKVAKGGALPPGWQKKVQAGEVLDPQVYDHGEVISHDDKGNVTIRVEDEIIKVVKDTREIIDILKR